MTKVLEDLTKIVESQNNLIKELALKLSEQEDLIEELLQGSNVERS